MEFYLRASHSQPNPIELLFEPEISRIPTREEEMHEKPTKLGTRLIEDEDRERSEEDFHIPTTKKKSVKPNWMRLSSDKNKKSKVPSSA